MQSRTPQKNIGQNGTPECDSHPLIDCLKFNTELHVVEVFAQKMTGRANLFARPDVPSCFKV